MYSPQTVRLKVLHHDRCFDGAASAALFARFYRDIVDPAVAIEFRGLLHAPGGAFDESVLDGDVNAILDFRYVASERLHWWFDHHASAFVTPADEAHFRADASGRKHFDARSASNTRFLVETLRGKLGWDWTPWRELVENAHLIDGAFFESAEQAVALAEPALQIMAVLEGHDDGRVVGRVVRMMTERTLGDIAADPEIAVPFATIRARHEKARARIADVGRLEGGVVHFDLSGDGFEAFNKFIPYALFPDARYSVAVTATRSRTKVSVGSNPWPRAPRTHDISEICRKYGGGGHAAVGAISFPAGELEKARAAAKEIVAVLQQG